MPVGNDFLSLFLFFFINNITQEKSRTEAALNAKIAQYDEDMASRYQTHGYLFAFYGQYSCSKSASVVAEVLIEDGYLPANCKIINLTIFNRSSVFIFTGRPR